jgi:hypothetical protein
MDQIELIRQHLLAAADISGVLSAGWEAFEVVKAVTAAHADLSADMYPAFTFARGAAVSGRNVIASAPSMPAACAAQSDSPVPVRSDVYEVADSVAALASALSARLRESATLAADADDRAACADAAHDADQISMLLARGE